MLNLVIYYIIILITITSIYLYSVITSWKTWVKFT